MGIAIAAALGFVAGVVAGTVSTIIGVSLKQWRNARLADRGEPGIKDVAWTIQQPILLGILATPIAAICAIWLSRWTAVAIGAGAPAALLVVGGFVDAMYRPGS